LRSAGNVARRWRKRYRGLRKRIAGDEIKSGFGAHQRREERLVMSRHAYSPGKTFLVVLKESMLCGTGKLRDHRAPFHKILRAREAPS